MADKGSADTFEYELAGRMMVLRKTTRSQLMMLQRMLGQLQDQMHRAADDPETVGALLSQLNDIAFEAAESRFTNPLDLAHVQREVLRGNVEESDIYAILSNGNKAVAPPDDDADPVPAKRARKAAVKKAAAKKPATRRAAR
jgi:hypothetical protein